MIGGIKMTTFYQKVTVQDINIFYREAGNPKDPTILLLHGFPSSSHMYKSLIEKLEDDYHLVAPDYPGFGNSDQPNINAFDYTFDNISNIINEFIEILSLEKFSIYVHDYGAPIGFRLATKNPHKIQAIISQNGNAYEEGLLSAWDPVRDYWENPSNENKEKLRKLLTADFTKYQYIDGTRNPDTISPDGWNMDQKNLDKKGNQEIQISLYYDYRNNLKLYPKWQKYFRTYQPPTLVAWGKNDMFFGPEGALGFLRDFEDCEVHLFNTGHFPLEEELTTSAFLIKNFLSSRLKQ